MKENQPKVHTWNQQKVREWKPIKVHELKPTIRNSRYSRFKGATVNLKV